MTEDLILNRLDRIDGKLDEMRERQTRLETKMDGVIAPGDGSLCAVHDEQLRSLAARQTKTEAQVEAVGDSGKNAKWIATLISSLVAAGAVVGKWIADAASRGGS